MKLLTNPHGSYATGDEIADAVLHYNLALMRRQDVDLVDIPFLDTDGAVRRVAMTIGWQSGVTATFDAEPADEVVEVDTILALYAKAAASAAIHAIPFTDEEAARMPSHPLDDEF